jgi:hypothetical protein
MGKFTGYLALILFFPLVFSCVTTKGGLPADHLSSQPAEFSNIEFRSDVFSRSFDEQFNEGYWVTRPSDGIIPVIGIAGRRANRDEAIELALTDAARRIALYHGLYAESATVLNEGSGFLDYFSDFDYRLTLNNEPSVYAGTLVFDRDNDVYEKQGAVYIRAKFSGSLNIPVYSTDFKDGVPDWVRNYHADIPGFLTGIGMSKTKGTPQATYQGSYENAIISLLPRLNTKVSSDLMDVAEGRQQRNITVSQASLTNVVILETWIDTKTNSVWTLLVAKENN